MRALQQLLNLRTGSQLELDADLGTLTENVLIAYQQNMSLEVDGVAGAETWKSLLNTK